MKKLFRFSLRTFLIFVLLFGAFGGWLANHQFDQRKEMDNLKKLFVHVQNPNTTLTFSNEAVSLRITNGNSIS